MDLWLIGLIAVVVVGLAVIAYGALSDRSKNQRRAAEMLAPPKRDIPRFTPDHAAPQYLSELQARRPPVDTEPRTLTPEARQQITRQLKDASTTVIATGYASKDFVTDASASWSVLDHPRILVCADRVESFREILGVLEKLVLSRTPLVLVAPGLAKDVLSTLAVNVIQRKMELVSVTPSTDELAAVVTASGATPIGRGDLQAGFVLPEHLGSCERWVSAAGKSYLIDASGEGSGP